MKFVTFSKNANRQLWIGITKNNVYTTHFKANLILKTMYTTGELEKAKINANLSQRIRKNWNFYIFLNKAYIQISFRLSARHICIQWFFNIEIWNQHQKLTQIGWLKIRNKFFEKFQFLWNVQILRAKPCADTLKMWNLLFFQKMQLDNFG